MVETENQEASGFDDIGKESIELSRNAKGQYAWKIKIKEELISGISCNRIQNLNDRLEKDHGNKGNKA